MEFDFAIFTDLCVPIVICACLCLGYILKHWIKDVDNKYIPTALAIFGAVTACIAKGDITAEIVIGGAFSGLVSTGLHQTFKQLINKE